MENSKTNKDLLNQLDNVQLSSANENEHNTIDEITLGIMIALMIFSIAFMCDIVGKIGLLSAILAVICGNIIWSTCLMIIDFFA